SKPLALVMALVDHFQIAQPIDPDRIYVVGLSMGGFGTWDLLQRQSEKYAAAVPICGGGDPTYAKKIGTVPIWAFHGDQDTVVKPHRSREMVQALRELGNPVIHTEYPGIGHNSWTPTAENRLVWDWLFAQRRRSEIEKDQP
ncbi:MAG: prolyl oligopeptidase family serine peptidase, partial [Planctomycetaceae bacterium]|nr:prolyl oligopeptidase family serine peptidase [Planctomycetaceae bacterium]